MHLVVQFAIVLCDPFEAATSLVELDHVGEKFAFLVEISESRFRYTNQPVLIWHGALRSEGADSQAEYRRGAAGAP